MHEDAVYGLTADPNNTSVFASACDDGRILVYDIREPPSSGQYVTIDINVHLYNTSINPFIMYYLLGISQGTVFVNNIACMVFLINFVL